MITSRSPTLSSLLSSMACLVIATLIPPSQAFGTDSTGSDAVIAQTATKRVVGEVSRSRVERASRLVIFFHGIRSRGSAMEAIGHSWTSVLPDTEFVSPDAPFANSSRGREWFVVDDQVMHPDRIEAARRAFDRLIPISSSEKGLRMTWTTSLSSACHRVPSWRSTRSPRVGGRWARSSASPAFFHCRRRRHQRRRQSY